MNVLLLNMPFIEHKNGELWSGPSAGSCWPHTVRGLYSYVPFPFFLANATSYLQAHGISADLLDAWAHRCTSYEQVQLMVQNRKPDVLVIEINTPLAVQTLAFAKWAKEALGCKIVLTGTHCAAYGDQLLAEPYIDHVVIGECDLPLLKIAGGDTRRKIAHEMLKDIETANGKPWFAYRDPAVIANYLDPSMRADPIQVQINDARGCPGFQCTFCAWPEVIYEHKYRARSAVHVLTEMRQLKERFKVGTWFFDSETWNGGRKERLVEMCKGLKEMGIPWTFMGRTDQSSHEEFEMFVDSGCVGCRIAPESFHQVLLDRVNKKLDAKKSWETCEWLTHRFPGFHLRLLTMYNMPGETPEMEALDNVKFSQLREMGRQNGVRVDVQRASCTPIPGTKLWRDLQAIGEGKELNNFAELQPNKPELATRLHNYSDVIPLTVKGKA